MLAWIGHSTTLIELDGARVLTDPVLRDRVGPLVRTAPPPARDCVAGLDAVLLSHLHYDHADLRSLAMIDESVPVLAPRGSGLWLERQGRRVVHELRVGEEATVGPLRIVGTRAVHEGLRRPLGVRAEAIGFVVRGSRSVYFAGDTDLFPDMAELAGSLDAALLPVAGWGRRLGAGHLDPARAAIAAGLTAPRLAIPIHWGTLAPPLRRLAPRVPDDAPLEFAALVARWTPAVEVRILAPGERTPIPSDAPVTA
jgi:L-ascorbate metabolism protein UlaG (beta-lactamase superfamily)